MSKEFRLSTEAENLLTKLRDYMQDAELAEGVSRESLRNVRDMLKMADLDKADLERQLAAREQAIVAQARALDACIKYIPASEVHNWPPGFRLKETALKLSRAALADPLVVECVAQAADDAEARRDAKMEGP